MPQALYLAALKGRNSRFIALTWARYVATSWSPQRSPAIRWKPRRVNGGEAAPQRWIIAASACFCCWLALAFGRRKNRRDVAVQKHRCELDGVARQDPRIDRQ
jgi:hypothetical protein